MKKIIYPLFLFGWALNLGAQTAPGPGGNACAISNPPVGSTEKSMNCGYSSADYANKYSRLQTYVPTVNTPVKTIKVALHFFQKTDGSNMWQNNAFTATTFAGVFNTLNNTHAHTAAPSWPVNAPVQIEDAKIRYEVTAMYFYQSDVLNSAWSPNDFESAVMAVDPSRLNSLPIYFTAGTHPQGASGLAIFPQTYLAMNSYVVMYNNGSNGSGGGTIDHELGHCLDLQHTYDSDVLSHGSTEYLSDIFGVSWSTYCGPPANTSCYHQGSWNWDPYDHVAHPYATNNLMGGCLINNWVSPLQMGKIHRALAIKNIRKYVKEMTSESNYPLNITASETWDFDIQMYQDIVVKPGATLTIKCKVGMANNGRIIVERGARLIIDGGEVNAWGTSWEGIQVWGTSNQKQQINGNGLSTYQGIVKVINSGTLRDAQNAIVTTKADADRNYDWGGYFGGIIQCDNAQFYNNRVSVAFMTYHNYPVPNVLGQNLSYINRSLFEVNNDMAVKAPSDPYLNAFVSLWNVEGVKLQGNFYQNICNPLPAIENRGNGVVSYDGGYTVDRYKVCSVWGTSGCAGYSENDQSRFLNLNYGVHAVESTPLASTTVNDNDFDNCNRAVYMGGTHNMRITNNRIKVNDGGSLDATYPYGIYSESSTAYDISNNVIGTNPGSFNNLVTGIFVYKTGGLTNMLYRNTTSMLNVGTTIIGDNRGNAPGQGLQLRCNKYGRPDLNWMDIWLHDDQLPWGNSGKIDAIQGSPATGANNLFSHDPSFPASDYYDEGGFPVSYYYNPATYQATQPLYYSPSLTAMALSAAYDDAGMCPAVRSSSGGGLHQRLMAVTTLTSEIASQEAIIDNNTTSWFLDAISGAITVAPADLKLALVNASPYLSDAVLIACFQSSLLTNDNIASLHAKNSPVSQDVWNVLLSLNLPKATMDKLNKKQFTGVFSARTALEAAIGDLYQQKALEIDEGIKDMLNDSLGYIPDSLVQLIFAGNDPGSLNRVLSYYVATNQVAAATEILGTIRSQHGGKLEDFSELQEIILNLKQTERNVYTLLTDEVTRSRVEDIAANKNNPAYVHAQALLSLVAGTPFYEYVALPDEEAGKGAASNLNQPATGFGETEKNMTIYPNPTNSNASVTCVLPEKFGSAMLVVYDMTGHQLLRQAVDSDKPATVLTTKGLTTGIYLINLVVDGQVIDNQKLIVRE